MKIPICECFGPVVQGEGHQFSPDFLPGYGVGTVTIFVRVGGCDGLCWQSGMCDSPYASDPAFRHKWKMMTPEQIVAKVQSLSFSPWLVTLTGGNPALYDFTEVIESLNRLGHSVALETQGTKYKPWFKMLAATTISPKPPSFSAHYTPFEVVETCIAQSHNP